MLRGMTSFKCDDCGNTFMGLDIEWNASAFSQPMKCPKCGSMHTYPSSSMKSIYREIWKYVDTLLSGDKKGK